MAGSGAHGRARQGTRRAVAPTFCLALGATLGSALPQAPARAQQFDARSPVFGQPDRPGIGQDAGSNGLPVLRRRLPDGPARDEGLGSPAGSTAGDERTGGDSLRSPLETAPPVQPGATLSPLDTRVTAGGRRTGGATTGPSNRTPSALLRARAAPPRKIGSATRQVTQGVTQVPTPALRLTPVVQQAVSGVPTPGAAAAAIAARPALPLLALSPALGLISPSFILGTDVARPINPDPAYAPLGYRIGNLLVFPSFGQSVGYDTNPDQTTRQLAKGSVALRTEAGLDFVSDGSSSQLLGTLRGAYLETPQNEEASRPAADGDVRLRVDATRDLQINTDFRFLVDTQRTTSANFQAQAGNVAAATSAGRPLFAVYGGSVGATETFNRLNVTLRGSVDRSQYENARNPDGTVINLSDQNLNQYSLELRTAYELTPDISPYVSVIGDTRVYDRRVDAGGVRRDSDGISFLAGASFGLARSVTGEIGAGLQHRSYVDPKLRDITAPLLSASLLWTISPLTAARFTAVSAVGETTLPNSSGILTDAATLEVQHDLLRNLSIVLGGSVLRNEYQGSRIRENGFAATARLNYRFTRYLTLRGTYIYQQLNSNAVGASYRDNTFLVGLRVNP